MYINLITPCGSVPRHCKPYYTQKSLIFINVEGDWGWETFKDKDICMEPHNFG